MAGHAGSYRWLGSSGGDIHTKSDCLTLAESAAGARCHVVALRRYIRGGPLKAKKLKHRYRVSSAELDRLLAADKPPMAGKESAAGLPAQWLPLDDGDAGRLRGYRRMAKAAQETAGRHPAFLGARGDGIVGFAVLDNPRRCP